MKIVANKYDAKDIIRIIRKNTKLSQAEFGKNLDVSGMTIQGYERGIRRYTFETLMKIAELYDIKITLDIKKSK